MKRSHRAGPAKPARKNEAPAPPWPVERHSGEGSASALETLQKLERSRVPDALPDPPASDDKPGT